MTVALVLVFGIEGIGTAAASALPGSPLYPAKLAAESVQLLVAYTPEQQAEAHLKIAAARLDEAAAVNQGGDSADVPILLQSFQEQLTAAEAAATKVQSPQYHEQVARKIASLEDRQRKIPPVVAASNQERGRRPEPNGATGSQPAASKPTTPSHDDDNPSRNPNKGHLDKTNEVATPEPPTATPVPSSTSAPEQIASDQANQPSEQLLKSLVARALAGDVSAATEASHAYVSAIRSDASSGEGADNKLHGQLAQLQQAIDRAPASTRQSLQDGIDAIGALLANTPGTDHPNNANANGSSKENGPPANSPPGSSNDRQGNSDGGGNSGNANGHGGDHNGNGGNGNGKGKSH